MTVKEFITVLKKQNPNALVCLSCDEEGNAYSRLSDGIANGNFKTDPDWFKPSFYGMEEGDFEKEYIILYPNS